MVVSCQQLQTQIEALSTLLTDGLEDIKNTALANKTELFNKLDTLTLRLNTVDTQIKDIEKYIESSDERLTKLEEEHLLTREEYNDLTERVRKLEEDNLLNRTLPINLKNLEEKIEERTNRQLRETLVIRNVPEDKPDESYNETKDLLAKLIADNVEDISYDVAFSKIKRAHREANRKDRTESRQGKRLIYAAFHSWDLCEKIKDTFRLKSIKDTNFNIYVDQKYGPITTKRRGMALRKRKELKESGIIVSGYIDFPAKLMVHYPDDLVKGKKNYKLYEKIFESGSDIFS